MPQRPARFAPRRGACQPPRGSPSAGIARPAAGAEARARIARLLAVPGRGGGEQGILFGASTSLAWLTGSHASFRALRALLAAASAIPRFSNAASCIRRAASPASRRGRKRRHVSIPLLGSSADFHSWYSTHEAAAPATTEATTAGAVREVPVPMAADVGRPSCQFQPSCNFALPTLALPAAGPCPRRAAERMAAQRPPRRPKAGRHPPQVSLQSGHSAVCAALRGGGATGAASEWAGGRSALDDARGAQAPALHLQAPSLGAAPQPALTSRGGGRAAPGLEPRPRARGRGRRWGLGGARCPAATATAPSRGAFTSARPQGSTPPRAPPLPRPPSARSEVPRSEPHRQRPPRPPLASPRPR